MSVSMLPTLNAFLNATSAVLVVAGVICIRAKKIGAHTLCMLSACAVSTAFLISYLTYHAQVGSIRFTGTGWIRPVYFAILISHTILAVVIVPLVLRTLWLAGRKRFTQHTAVARWTVPLWLYVSITGVLVYWLLYHMPSAEACPGCKEALFDPAQLQQKLSTAKGYALSIGVLLSVPLVLLGGIVTMVVRARRNRARI